MVSRKPRVTYEVTANACDYLKGRGELVSCHAVRRIVGGSNSTLLPFVNRWKDENDYSRPKAIRSRKRREGKPARHKKADLEALVQGMVESEIEKLRVTLKTELLVELHAESKAAGGRSPRKERKPKNSIASESSKGAQMALF